MKSIRKLCSKNNKNYFVSTPIYYVNAAPHIGHLYSSVIADAIQRWHKISHPNDSIIFSTGTDEHGMKIQQAASNNKTTVSEYCKNISEKYRLLFNTYNIGHTNFIRTTDDVHKKAVQHFWNAIHKNGHIYSSQYSGWYCVSDETFLSDSQLTEKLLPNGNKIKVSLESGHPVEWSEEQNYMFRLSTFQDDLKYWLRQNENCVRPNKFHKILYELADSDAMGDVSISRPISRVFWGIPVPGDPDHSIYVWMDALVNYLTAVGYPDIESQLFKNSWPPDVQVIGKDILKFHGIYWPAFLMAAGLEPPKTLFCHSHWTVDGQKMSKSKQNVVCPYDKLSVYTSDGLRYFLLREGVAHSDGNYSEIKLIRILNSELADTLGNLLSRCCGVALNPNQEFPVFNPDIFNKLSKENCTQNLLEQIQKLPEVTRAHYEEFNFYKVVDATIAALHAANLFFETMKPWELKKSSTTIDDLHGVLHLTMETLRICAIILQPVIPHLTDQLLNKINIPNEERSWKNITPFSWDNPLLNNPRPLTEDKAVLFKRIILEKEKMGRKKVK